MESSPVKASKALNNSQVPVTPNWMAPLSRELETVIAQKNILTCRTRRKVLADLQTNAEAEENEQMEKLRLKSVEEVVGSEKSYLRHLEIAEEFFMRPIEESELLPHDDFVKVFGYLTSILQVNRELLKGLECDSDKIGKVFTQLAPYLKFYSTYTNDFRNAVKIVDKHMSKSKAFRTLVLNQESRPEVQLKLNSLLITPVQRIPRYKLLLEDVIKKTPNGHPDKKCLQDALEQIEGVAWHINEQLRDHENAVRMLDIQRSMVGGQPKILAPGRKLLKQGILMKVPRTGASGGQPRYFVLFSDTLMYCKIKNVGVPVTLPKFNALDCGCVLPLKRVQVETVVGRGVFKLTCEEEELLLYSIDGSTTSDEWVTEILDAANKQKTNAATLRKESSRRTPLKRPDLIKLRRESLSQIMMLRVTKEKAKRLLLTPKSSEKRRNLERKCADGSSPVLPSRKRKASGNDAESPSKSAKTSTPKARPCDSAEAFRTPYTSVPPPPAIRQSELQMRAKNKRFGRKDRTLSFKMLSRLASRKERLKAAESKPSLFRSPSIYENASEDDDNGGGHEVMASYLDGKIVPLTPSQRPTNVSHLACSDPNGKADDDGSTLSTSFSTPKSLMTGAFESPDDKPARSGSSPYCVVM